MVIIKNSIETSEQLETVLARSYKNFTMGFISSGELEAEILDIVLNNYFSNIDIKAIREMAKRDVQPETRKDDNSASDGLLSFKALEWLEEQDYKNKPHEMRMELIKIAKDWFPN